MKFYAHWARARGTIETEHGPQQVAALGWSDDSEAAARELAERRLGALGERFRSGFPAKNDYDYGADRPAPEPIASRVRDTFGQDLAVITRNAYGALVLNTDRALFIDVDFGVAAPATGWLKALFQKPVTPERAALERVERALAAFPGWALRVYRTYAGLRLLLLTESLQGFEPRHLEVLDQFGSDPLYRKLCLAQRCFRARLTPKPWRVGLARPPRFPFATEKERARFDAWQRRYDEQSAKHASCQLLTTLGLGHPTETVRTIVAAHDALALREGAPLA
jgi:hypothetical protein